MEMTTCPLCHGRRWYVQTCPHRWLGPGCGYDFGLPPRAVGCWACLGASPTQDAPVPVGVDTSTARSLGARMVVTGRSIRAARVAHLDMMEVAHEAA